MRLHLIIPCTILLTAACKKREEVAILQVPNAGNARIVEIKSMDENVANHTFHGKYYHDETGRMIKIEIGDNPSNVVRYEYQNGKLSKIIADFLTTTIKRNEQGWITEILEVTGSTVHKKTFHYDQIGNLVFFTEGAANDSASVWSDTTLCSHFVNGRYTQSTTRTHGSGTETGFTKVNKLFDTQGRLISSIKVAKWYRTELVDGHAVQALYRTDSTSTTNEYSEFPAAERTFREKNIALIKDHYSTNLDVYEMLTLEGPIAIDYFPPARKAIYESGYIRLSAFTVEERNPLGLPTTELTMESFFKEGVVTTPSLPRRVRRTIRYEVD